MVRRSGSSWRKILIISFVLALGVASSKLGAGNYPSFGIFLNWLLGLPCWLLGVQLAELVVEDKAPKPNNIWIWRIGTLTASAVCSVLRHHSTIGYPWTLNIFAILVFFWLLQEIRFYRYETPSKLLEWIGRWSYSIYLVHLLAQVLWVNTLKDVNLGYLPNWIIKIVFILVISYVFSVIVEMPTHNLARGFARRFGIRKQETSSDG
jgi:peptidoglycan/LPS O-acetylase OafA/YrhL